MYSRVLTGAISGIESLLATVEVDVSNGMPGFEMVGLLNHEVREARERVKVALKNTIDYSSYDNASSTYCFPPYSG